MIKNEGFWVNGGAEKAGDSGAFVSAVYLCNVVDLSQDCLPRTPLSEVQPEGNPALDDINHLTAGTSLV